MDPQVKSVLLWAYSAWTPKNSEVRDVGQIVKVFRTSVSILWTKWYRTVRQEHLHVIMLSQLSETRFTFGKRILFYQLIYNLLIYSLASVTKRAFRWIHCTEFKNLYITIYNTHVLIKYKICLGILGSISIESRCASYRANHNFT